MTTTHTQSALVLHNVINDDIKGSLGVTVSERIQFSSNSAIFKATTTSGKTATQIPDGVVYVQHKYDQKLYAEPELDVEDTVIDGPTHCYRLEVCNSEDSHHGLHKVR